MVLELKGRGVAELASSLFASPFIFKSMCLDFKIKCFILMTIKNWLQNSYLPNKKKKKSLCKPTVSQSVGLCDCLDVHSRDLSRHKRKSQLLSVHLNLLGETAFMLHLNYWVYSLNVAVEDIQGVVAPLNLYSLLSCTLQRQVSYCRRDVKYNGHNEDLFALGLHAVLTKWLQRCRAEGNKTLERVHVQQT